MLGRGAHLGLHFAAPLVLGIIGWHLVTAVQENAPLNCNYAQAYLPAPHLVLVGLLAFVAGRYISALSPSRGAVSGQDAKAAAAGSKVLGQVALMVTFIVMTAVWFFEAIGTAHVAVRPTGTAEYEPITFYIRYAIYQDRAANGVGWWTVFIVGALCALGGHWLWSRHAGREETAPDQVSLA